MNFCWTSSPYVPYTMLDSKESWSQNQGGHIGWASILSFLVRCHKWRKATPNKAKDKRPKSTYGCISGCVNGGYTTLTKCWLIGLSSILVLPGKRYFGMNHQLARQAKGERFLAISFSRPGGFKKFWKVSFYDGSTSEVGEPIYLSGVKPKDKCWSARSCLRQRNEEKAHKQSLCNF